jgi:nitrogen fixation NifU-like protein
MDRETTIAWIEELARDTTLLAAVVPEPILAQRSRVNPTCGDQVHLSLQLSDQGTVRVRGSVRGCSLSTAATVLAARAVDELTVTHARPLITTAIDSRLTGTGAPPGGDLGLLSSLELVPLRRRCVAFPWQVIAELLNEVAADT